MFLTKFFQTKHPIQVTKLLPTTTVSMSVKFPPFVPTGTPVNLRVIPEVTWKMDGWMQFKFSNS